MEPDRLPLFRDAVVPYDDEGEAIGQAPLLVGVAFKKRERLLPELRSCYDHRHFAVEARTDPARGALTQIGGIATSVSRLQENPIGGPDHGASQLLRSLDSAIVMLIA